MIPVFLLAVVLTKEIVRIPGGLAERPAKERGVYEENEGESHLQSDDAFAQADTAEAGSAAFAVGIF